MQHKHISNKQQHSDEERDAAERRDYEAAAQAKTRFEAAQQALEDWLDEIREGTMAHEMGGGVAQDV